VPVYKIASMDVTYIPLIREVAATGKPILLSTGMATLAEIGYAVDAALNAGGDQLVLLHCISKYPPSADEANLRTMTQISEAFGLPVGYSDHVLGNTVALASIALGACVLEKHFTIGKDLPGPDHAISADITQMRALVESIRELESAFGSRCADTSRPDRSQAAVMRRGLYAARDLKAGDVIGTDDVLCVRPENSMKPTQLESVQGQPVAADIKAEAPLSIKSV